MENEGRAFYKEAWFLVLIAILAMVSIFFATSWLGDMKESKAVKEDLSIYVNQVLPGISIQEREIVELHNSMNEDTVIPTVANEIMPKMKSFLSTLESTRIETAELADIHEIYIKSNNVRNSSYMKILVAYEERDSDKLAEANDMISEARVFNRDYQKKLKAFAEEHDVTINDNLFYNLRED